MPDSSNDLQPPRPNNPGEDAPPKADIDPKWKRFYDKLLQERDRVIEVVKDFGAQGRDIVSDPIKNSLAEVGTETFHRDQLLGTAAANQRRLMEIDAAIARIEDGTYGVCLATGKPIPEARLEAVPWARFTVEVEEELEASGEAPTTSIGGIGSVSPDRPQATANVINQK